jgi:predicted nucleotidyltransferase
MKKTRKSNESKAEILNYHGVRFSQKRIEEFCRRWKIKELSLFGSVLRGDFHPKSDVDVLVRFEPDVRWYSDHLLEMKEELESLFKRSVDLVEKRLVEESPNYIRRKHILENMESIYVA